MFKDVNNKVLFPKLEEEILQYWKKQKIFERSVKERTKKEYTFYDGPPFATGMPHYGHILAGVMKDVIPRYWTMKGYKVERRFGWDCHGLPVENVKEKELGISGKKDIEKMGIANFNESCRSIVQRYVEDWKKVIERTGRWVDMDNDYKTMDTSYMETIWWVFKQLWDKGLIYEGEKVVPYCYRCATPLSNFEATQGYQDKQDTTVIVKFEVEKTKTTLDKLGLQHNIQDHIYFLAWTTTPWTLPSNLALAVHPDYDYVVVHDKDDDNIYIFLQNQSVYKRLGYEEGKNIPFISANDVGPHGEINPGPGNVLNIIRGKDLVGIKYEPLFPYFKDKKDAFKILTADFVTTEDGTGIVHIAPAYGEDDYYVCKANKIRLVNPVDEVGCFTDAVTDFAGRNVHEANKDIIHFLKEKGKIVRQDTIQHSYPFCWRCDTPLIYKAIPTWFVNVTKLKKKMLKNNDKIAWVPDNIKYGRFGVWLENARDWAISRNRYWGSAMPVWRCDHCQHCESLGSLEDLYQKVPERMTKLILVRHGESEKNLVQMHSNASDKYPLTEKGRKDIENIALQLANEKIDHIYASPTLRTRETAEIIAEKKNMSVDYREEIIDDQDGLWSEKRYDDPSILDSRLRYKSLSDEERFDAKRGETGESRREEEKRIMDFVSHLLETEKGKTIMLVSHLGPLNLLKKALKGWSISKFFAMGKDGDHTGFGYDVVYVDNETKKEFDLHKHIVDGISFPCAHEGCPGTMKRIPEVLDCWFESGSMPYAQVHYPFENKEWFEQNFPADFIAEGQDQTRGWFYTLIVLSSALFNKPAFKNVIVNGIVLAEDGKKMSKRLKNYPDPLYILDSYGADAMRFYLMSSPAVQAQDLRFTEKGVDEVVKSVLLPLWNAYSFFVTYANIDKFNPKKLSKTFSDKRDQWVLSLLQGTIEQVTDKLDHYDLSGATQPMLEFLDGLTNWYIRRSRRRFWKSENDTDKKEAYSALYIVLTTFTKLIAPYTPFIAEEIYRNLTNEDSVHLASWPKVKKEWYNKALNEESDIVRNIVTLGLSARAKNKIKVRQPLALMEVVIPHYAREIMKEYEQIIQEELNVKEIRLLEDSEQIAKKVIKPIGAKIGSRLGKDAQEMFKAAKENRFQWKDDGTGLSTLTDPVTGISLNPGDYEITYEGKEGFDVESNKGVVVALDIHVTEELRQEGIARDIIRMIQDMRKEANYHVSDRIQISIQGCDPSVLEKFGKYIQAETLAQEIVDLPQFDLERILEDEDLKILIRINK